MNGHQGVGVLVIGYGNPLRGDDIAGSVVAERVAGWRVPGVEVLATHQLVPELTARMAAVAMVVFVDASVAEPEVRLRRIEPSDAVPTLDHASKPATLLGLTAAAFGRVPAAWLLTIPASRFDLGNDLSPEAVTGIEEALAQLRVLVGSRRAHG